MPDLFVARYQPGLHFEGNPFDRLKNDHATIELLAIDGDELGAVVLFSTDEVTARTVEKAGATVERATPGRYRDSGSEASIVVQVDGSYLVEDDAP